MAYVLRVIVPIALPLLIGLMIYAIFRPNSFIAGECYLFIPKIFNSTQILKYEYVSYYIPDFMWAFSICSSLIIIWRRSVKQVNLLIAAFSISCTFEFLQYFGFIKGYFDYYDLIMYLMGCVFCVLLFNKFDKLSSCKRYNNE